MIQVFSCLIAGDCLAVSDAWDVSRYDRCSCNQWPGQGASAGFIDSHYEGVDWDGLFDFIFSSPGGCVCFFPGCTDCCFFFFVGLFVVLIGMGLGLSMVLVADNGKKLYRGVVRAGCVCEPSVRD